MQLISRSLLSLMLICCSLSSSADVVEVPYQKFVLDNGLTLIVHEDHKAPLVAVELWYHVGSKNEKAGQTGFAHLFEHLMFNGSEHFNDEYFRPFEKAGATDQNGTTSNDRTNYFATVPTPALDMALWMESDRMGHLLPAIDQAKLDEQRGVVKNEKRQGDDRPFGHVREKIARDTFPPGHPYSWETIGSMQDLDAASLDDVHNWFKQYYGPNNAVLVLAGDIDPQTAKQKVEHYFGAIPANPPLQQTQTWIAKRNEERRDTMQDRVPNARVYLVWNTPAQTDPISTRLGLLADIIAGGPSGLLTQRLVQKEKLANSVRAFQYEREIAGQFWIMADPAPGIAIDTLEQRVRAALQDIVRSGFSKQTLTRAKTNYQASFLRQLEKVGGFSGKANLLASGEVFAKNPAAYRDILRDIETTTAEQLQTIARQWLDSGVYVLQVTPYPPYKIGSDTVERAQVPSVGPAPAPNLPAIQRATLDNGLQLLLLRRSNLPLVEIELQLPIGHFVDGWEKAGTDQFALQMLLESNGGRDAAAIAGQALDLGADIDAYTRIDASGLKLSALKDKLADSTELFAQLIRQPDFAADAIKTLQNRTLNAIKREENDLATLAERVLPRLVFGDSHADGGPLTGTGRSEVISAIDRAQLQAFHQRWFNPNQATLLAVGDLDIEQFKTLAQNYFGNWKNTPQENASAVTPPIIPTLTAALAQDAVYFIDRPGSAQANVSAALALPPSSALDMGALGLANAAFGGGFTSRLNLNLREDKHWSYGTHSNILESRGLQLWIASGNVQIDKAGPALKEMQREWNEFTGTHPLTQEELDKVREQRIRQLPGAYETNGALLQAVSKNLRLQRPDNYLATESDALQKLDLNAVRQQAKILNPSGAVWLVIGDKQKILPQLQQAGLKQIIELNADGEINSKTK